MEFYNELNRLSRESTCLVGVGNYTLMDDAVGLYIVDQLIQRAGNVRFSLLNAETVPENYIVRLCETSYRNIVFVDAVHGGLGPGSVILEKLDEVDEYDCCFSTHKLSLQLCGRMLMESGKVPYFMGIEAASIYTGFGLTVPVKRAADILVDLIILYSEFEMSELNYVH